MDNCNRFCLHAAKVESRITYFITWVYWKLYCDRRCRKQAWSRVLLITAFIIFMVAIAIAGDIENSIVKLSATDEHIKDVMLILIESFVGLGGLFVTIVGWVFVSNIKDIKNATRRLEDKLDSHIDSFSKDLSGKIGRDEHDKKCVNLNGIGAKHK